MIFFLFNEKLICFIGFNRFQDDIYMMLKKKPAKYYLFATWCITAPILTDVSFISSLLWIDEVISYIVVDDHHGKFSHVDRISFSRRSWLPRIRLSQMEYGTRMAYICHLYSSCTIIFHLYVHQRISIFICWKKSLFYCLLICFL